MASRFVVVQGCPPSWALHGLPKLTLNLHPTTTLFPKVSRGPIVRALHSKHSTFRSLRGRGRNKIKSTKFHAKQFAVSLSSVHIRGVWVFTHESFMLSTLLGLRRSFLCSRVSVAYFLSIFGSSKVCFDQVWNQKPSRFKGQDAILILSK